MLSNSDLQTADSNRPEFGKTRRLTDSSGTFERGGSWQLFALVTARGSLGWRLRWTLPVPGKPAADKLMSLGVWPDVSPDKARELAAIERGKIERGHDPAHERAAVKVAANAAQAATFGLVGAEVMEIVRQTRSPKTAQVWVSRFNLMRKLHPRPVSEITTGEILAVLESLQRDAGLGETAWRCGNIAEAVFRRAIATDRAKINPALSSHFRGQLKTPTPENRAHLTDPAKVGQLMDWLETPGDTRDDKRMSSYPTVRNALRLVARTWLRSIELRGGRWDELRDLDGANPEWHVPAGRMKMKRPHVVPLSRQAVAILKEQRALVDALGGSPLMFPGGRGMGGRPITPEALTNAINTLWKDEHSVHGFRHTASTLCHEQGWDSAVIELNLAHTVGNSVARVYNKSERLDARREVMQKYSDLLDTLASQAAKAAAK